jgi:hypothetical protein
MNENKNKPSPQLKAAMAEMIKIAEKHDIGAHIILASKEHGEYQLHFPTWSKAQIEGHTGIRFKAKGKDEDSTLASTVHMLQVFSEVSEQLSNATANILRMLSEKMIITGGPKRV